jgi:hypothetical protein
MAAAPGHQPRHVRVGDLGDQPGPAEALDDPREVTLGVVGAGMVLPDLVPVAVGHVIKFERRVRALYLLHALLGALPVPALDGFRFASCLAAR